MSRMAFAYFLKFCFQDTLCQKIWRVPHLLPQVHTQTGWIPIVDLHHSQASVGPCKPCSAYTFWTRNRCCICDIHTSLLQCSMFDIHSLQRCSKRIRVWTISDKEFGCPCDLHVVAGYVKLDDGQQAAPRGRGARKMCGTSRMSSTSRKAKAENLSALQMPRCLRQWWPCTTQFLLALPLKPVLAGWIQLFSVTFSWAQTLS